MAEQITHHPDEQEPKPRDISQQFLEMRFDEWWDFLRSLRKEPSLSITVDYGNLDRAKRLKAWIEDFGALERNQKRIATIRATESQHKEAANIFASGVKLEKVEEKPCP